MTNLYHFLLTSCLRSVSTLSKRYSSCRTTCEKLINYFLDVMSGITLDLNNWFLIILDGKTPEISYFAKEQTFVGIAEINYQCPQLKIISSHCNLKQEKSSSKTMANRQSKLRILSYNWATLKCRSINPTSYVRQAVLNEVPW